ncbi:MAG: DoxX family protein [Patescibacteria group bacterium]
MLNPLPDLLAFGLLAPFLLRVTLGLVFLDFGWNKLRRKDEKAAFFESLGWRPGARYALVLGIVEVVCGLALLVGVYTQIAALAAAVILAGALYLKQKHREKWPHDRRLFLLLLVISLSLIFSGAGFLAFDLPL